MLASTLALLAALLTLALGSPVPRGYKYTKKDADVLNYALTAELLEANYYDWGLKKWSQEDFVKAGQKEDTRALIIEIRDDEVAHAAFITEVLKSIGEPYVKPGEYKFPVKNVNEFVKFAAVLEQIGASAYSGAAALLTSAEFVERAATVLAIEARQSAFLRHLDHFSPFPATFETPLTPSQVVSLASQLIVSQPADNPDFSKALSIEALAVLTVEVPELPTKVGSKIKVAYDGYKPEEKAYAIFLSEGFFFIAAVENGYTTIPDGVAAGQIYVYLSKSDSYDKADSKALTGVAFLDIKEEPTYY